MLEPYAGASEYRQPRPAGRRGPAADAGGQRQLPRLVSGGRRRRRARATSTCASSGTARARPTVEAMAPGRSWRSTPALCAWTLARAHARSGDAIAIGAYLGSRRALRRRPRRVLAPLRGPERSATTRRSWRRSTPVASSPKTPEGCRKLRRRERASSSAYGEMGSARRPRRGPVPDGPRPGGDERRDLPAGRGLRHDGDHDPGGDRALRPGHGGADADRRQARRHHRAAARLRDRPRASTAAARR